MTNDLFKIDNRTIKASFKDCLISDRKKFLNSKCIMPISVGQKVHEGSKFLAVLKLINNNFKACTILVDDSIQRYTMKIESPLDMDTLYNLAIEQGDLWLERNKSLLSQLTIPYNIVRWDDWKNYKNYSNIYKEINRLFDVDVTYQEAINENVKDFLSRYHSGLETNSFNYKQGAELCVEYLKEECAVMCLWAEAGYDFEVYPTGRNKAMSATYEKLIHPKFPDLLKSVSIRFKKYGTIEVSNPAKNILLEQDN